MADRSGIPEIDDAIVAFLAEPMGDWTTDDDPIAVLADGERATGLCHMVSEQFAVFAADRGLKVYACDTDVDELGYKHRKGAYFTHTVAEVYLEGTVCTVIVDFTASQYGYKDHPKVTA
jgi:hypothetical protein